MRSHISTDNPIIRIDADNVLDDDEIRDLCSTIETMILHAPNQYYRFLIILPAGVKLSQNAIVILKSFIKQYDTRIYKSALVIADAGYARLTQIMLIQHGLKDFTIYDTAEKALHYLHTP